MFGRQIFLKPVDNQHDERRNDYIRQLSPSQGHGIPFTELISVPYLRNDGLMLDLNFIFIDDDHVQSNNLNNLYFQTNRGNISNRYLLEYIRQMKERYLFMERELTRARMLIPVISRNTNAVHQSAQTDINWNECSLTKYGHFLGTSSKNQYKKNSEQINVSSRRKHYTMKRNKENSIRKTLTESDWMKHRISSQNLQNDIYPIKEPDSNTFQPRSLTSNSTTVCSMHNIAVILPQDSIQLNDLSKHKQAESKINVDIHKAVDKLDSDESKIFGNSKKYFNPFETRKTSMEICQSFDKKHEPETSNYTDFDVKHEDCTQTKPAVNTPEFRPIMGSKFNNDISDQSTSHCQQQNINSEEKCNRNYWNNYTKKLPYGRTRANDSSRQFTRIVQKQKKEMHKRIPTPRSNVHTAYTPMTQPSTWNSMLDPNGFTIQLLRLAVLLYAPALMPALNSLIARQSIQTTIPHFEGSNDLLTQIFTILNNQQCVPNLSYAPNPRMDENSRQFRESSTHNSSAQSNSENLTKQFQNDTHRIKTFDNNQFEKNSIAVNTSLEICSCNTIKQSPSQSYNKNILHNQEDEKLVYTWTSKKSSKSSETVVLEKPILKNEQNKEKVSENQQENSEFFENWLIQKDPNVWDDPKSKSSNIWQQYVNQ